MIEEFDKEIDALLRRAAQGETAFAAANRQSASGNSHLDADAISAFAENALPEKTKQHYTKHFADCERCRKVLSNVITANAETVSEAEARKAAVVSLPAPWYRKLFVYPNLAYTLGALVLVFSGLVAFVILQNNPRNSEVSQVSERPLNGKGMSSDGETMPAMENYSNAASANTALSASSMSNFSSTATKSSSMNSAIVNSNAAPATKKTGVPANQTPKEEPHENSFALAQNRENFTVDGADNKKTDSKRERAKEDEKQDNNEAGASLSARSIQSLPKAAAPPVSEDKVTSDAPKAPMKKSAAAKPETTTVGGKTFKRQDNMWIDSSYKGQAAINITRGTNEYKKLDSGLRSIVENLGGTVVVVWKEKPFRIQ